MQMVMDELLVNDHDSPGCGGIHFRECAATQQQDCYRSSSMLAIRAENDFLHLRATLSDPRAAEIGAGDDGHLKCFHIAGDRRRRISVDE